MSTSILFSDTPEHFYQQLRECIQQTIQKELSPVKNPEEEIYLKKHEVCKMLQVSKPTVDSHVNRGYYKKHYMGSRVFFNKQEILAHLNREKKTT
jgi:predicted DNA-binding transcriptional regulator AlpA